MKSSQTGIYLKSEQKFFLLTLFIKSLLSVFVFFTLTGCEKEEEETPFPSYLRMTLNGERLECDYDISANRYIQPNISPTQELGIYGNWKYGTLQEGYIEFRLFRFDNVIGQKSFSPPSNVMISRVQVNDIMGIHSIYYNAEGKDVNFIIEEVSDRYIKGIFDIIARGPETYDSLGITGGEFNIYRKQ